MLSIEANPRLDRQLTPEGPILLWRDAEVGRREGLLVVSRGPPFPPCPGRHLALAVYPLNAMVAVVEVGDERVWTIDREGSLELLWLAFEGDADLDAGTVRADRLAEPALVAWLAHELDAELLGALSRELERAEGRGAAQLGRSGVRGGRGGRRAG